MAGSPLQRAFVTGGAGFIGSNLAEALIGMDIEVVVYDNFSTGRREFLAEIAEDDRLSVVEGDILDEEKLGVAISGCDTVFHLAANADVRYGLADPTRDLAQNTIGTSRVLEAMRANGVERILFSSTGSIYGEPNVFPTPESCPFPVQTSLYGASKLAAESLIEAYCHGYNLKGVVCRFVSVLGERYSHGHVIDFYRSLVSDPKHLHVLGDGKQKKSYLYVRDCISGMLEALAAQSQPGVSTYNLGSDETLVVDESVEIICQHMGVEPEVQHAGGERGWIGDSPLILLDCTRLRDLGWRPQVKIEQAVRQTLAWLDSNPWILDLPSSAVQN